MIKDKRDAEEIVEKQVESNKKQKAVNGGVTEAVEGKTKEINVKIENSSSDEEEHNKEEETMKSESIGVKSESVADAKKDESEDSDDVKATEQPNKMSETVVAQPILAPIAAKKEDTSDDSEDDSDDCYFDDEMDPYECPCGRGDIVLRTSCQPDSLDKHYYACPRSNPRNKIKKYGCGFFIWKAELDLQLGKSSSHGPSTPQGSPEHSGSGPTECSNCKVKDLRIKMLEERLKMSERQD